MRKEWAAGSTVLVAAGRGAQPASSRFCWAGGGSRARLGQRPVAAGPEREARRRQDGLDAAEQHTSLRPCLFSGCFTGLSLTAWDLARWNIRLWSHGLSPRSKLRPDKEGDFLVLSTLAHGLSV